MGRYCGNRFSACRTAHADSQDVVRGPRDRKRVCFSSPKGVIASGLGKQTEE